MGNRDLVYIAMRGGERTFPESAIAWLEQWEFASPHIIGPDARNMMSIGLPSPEAERMARIVFAGNEPEGLWEAVFPPPPKSHFTRHHSGKNCDLYDRRGRTMPQAGRKVGITPGHMARNGGW